VVIAMNMKATSAATLVLALFVSGCGDGLTAYRPGPDTVIAVGEDRGWDTTRIPDQRAAIAYDPDGCQNWIIDDGVEGYSTPRYDPATGMANVCNNRFPPGAVIGDYQSGNQGIRDRVPARGLTRRPAN
jgi:hypothetical protein